MSTWRQRIQPGFGGASGGPAAQPGKDGYSRVDLDPRSVGICQTKTQRSIEVFATRARSMCLVKHAFGIAVGTLATATTAASPTTQTAVRGERAAKTPAAIAVAMVLYRVYLRHGSKAVRLAQTELAIHDEFVKRLERIENSKLSPMGKEILHDDLTQIRKILRNP